MFTFCKFGFFSNMYKHQKICWKGFSKVFEKFTASCRNVKIQIKENKKVKKKDRIEPSAKLLGSKVEKNIKVKQKNQLMNVTLLL